MTDPIGALKSKQVSLVWYQDLDKFIELYLGRPWNTQQDYMAGQDTLRIIEVGPDPAATEQVELWLASPEAQFGIHGRDEVISTDILLAELCNRGLLDEGELYVHWW